MTKPFTRFIVFFSLLILVSATGFSQPSFCKRNYMVDDIQCVVQTPDGGYALGGTTIYGQADSDDFHIIKTDSVGNVKWSKTIGGPGNDWGYAMVYSKKDKGLVMAGLTYGFGMGGQDGYLAKVDSAGNLLWTRSIGGSGYDFFTSLAKTYDGGYIAAGGTNSFGAGSDDVYVVKFDSLGTVEWTRTIGGTSADGSQTGTSIIQTADSGYAISASTISFDYTNNSYDIYVIKLNRDGSLAWTKTVGGSRIEEPFGIVQSASDYGYAVAGRTMSFYGTQYYLVKLSSSGTIQWTKTAMRYGNDDCLGLTMTKDGGYALIGRSMPAGPNPNYYDIFLTRFDAVGNFMWSRTIGSSDPMDWEEGRDIIQTRDGGFAIAGTTANFLNGPDPFKCYFVKLDANGNGCCVKSVDETPIGAGGTNNLTGGIVNSGGTFSSGGVVATFGYLQAVCTGTTFTVVTSVAELQTEKQVNISPNPFADQTVVSVSEPLHNASIFIINSVGEIVNSFENVSGEKIIVPRQELKTGLYFIRITQNNKVVGLKKMVVTD